MPTLQRRCYSAKPVTGDTLVIDGPEAHHLLHVLRVQPGQSLVVFDGTGVEFACDVSECRRAEIELVVRSAEPVDRELPYSLELGVALPKGDRTRWIIEKCVELGVTKVTPLVTDYGDRKAKLESATKLQRHVIEASKQCGRNVLLGISRAVQFAEWVQESGEHPCLQLLAHPGGVALHRVKPTSQGPTRLAIGPEGGFSDVEVAQAQAANWQIVDLGPRILRIETAALKLVAAVAE
ncbi:RsmE family RNA methyltransferase [Adhaeretor mobilis]|uniref:Ribosomal RNA small subunit methyltransferase E n=1 Tax=Adhaeretor mobilis TaxID=1930276 RepID=A0A517MQL4_9BACT|nr:RsmE family RNA methyltransferase [Adhaeretor mobilis]QDS97179.1 Ribosomal RNA small subunit methyltransferase E [Adhaeretor mobilis]